MKNAYAIELQRKRMERDAHYTKDGLLRFKHGPQNRKTAARLRTAERGKKKAAHIGRHRAESYAGRTLAARSLPLRESVSVS